MISLPPAPADVAAESFLRAARWVLWIGPMRVCRASRNWSSASRSSANYGYPDAGRSSIAMGAPESSLGLTRANRSASQVTSPAERSSPRDLRSESQMPRCGPDPSFANAPGLRTLIARDQLVVELVDGQIRTDWLIVAANAWIQSLLPIVHMASSLTFACATERLSRKVVEALGLEEGIPFYTVDLPYLWGRMTSESRVIFGSGLLFDSSERLEEIGLKTRSFARAIDTLTRRVRGLHPALTNIRFSHAWAGPIAFTEDHMPILTYAPNQRRMLVAGAYAGHGVAMSVRAGELLAVAVARNDPLPEWGAFSR